ncbi:MAG TPA: hypothetical protein VK524_14560 [Polyangiaceae bacterium]|nr:hypothetical protein [Polyangiaceae bacterium]
MSSKRLRVALTGFISAGASSAGGCDSTCNDIGCAPTCVLQLSTAISEPGEYEVSVTWDGQVHSCTLRLPSDVSQPTRCDDNALWLQTTPVGLESVNIMSGFPRSVTLSLRRGDATLVNTTLNGLRYYEDLHGDACTQPCKRATSTVPV